MPELTDAEPFGVLTAQEVIALEMHVLDPEHAENQLALIESIAAAHERRALEDAADEYDRRADRDRDAIGARANVAIVCDASTL